MNPLKALPFITSTEDDGAMGAECKSTVKGFSSTSLIVVLQKTGNLAGNNFPLDSTDRLKIR